MKTRDRVCCQAEIEFSSLQFGRNESAMPVEEITEVFNHLQLQVFVPPSSSLISQLVPETVDNPLTWTKLRTMNFVSMQAVVDMMTNVRKKVVANLDANVLAAISSALEQIRIPTSTLFSSSTRFPEGE